VEDDGAGPSSFLSRNEVSQLGLGAHGDAIHISRHARIYEPSRIRLGSHVRIDDFAVISPGSGRIYLAGHNHIAVGVLLFGSISIGAWSTVSSRTAIYARSDDFRFDAVTYPDTDDETLRRTIDIPIAIGERVVIGTGCTLLPGAQVGSGISVGAMSLVTRPLLEAGLYLGVPARHRRSRSPL
jgi:dTDP-4-amino-4,6-dideoxy-D-glucose acyltransferase